MATAARLAALDEKYERDEASGEKVPNKFEDFAKIERSFCTCFLYLSSAAHPSSASTLKQAMITAHMRTISTFSSTSPHRGEVLDPRDQTPPPIKTGKHAPLDTRAGMATPEHEKFSGLVIDNSIQIWRAPATAHHGPADSEQEDDSGPVELPPSFDPIVPHVYGKCSPRGDLQVPLSLSLLSSSLSLSFLF
jgi:hypothetical protein